MFRQASWKRMVIFRAGVPLMLGLGLVIAAAAQGAPRDSQGEKKAPPVKKEYRYAPSMAIVMSAYEGVLNNNEQTNPKAVRALKQSFARNPSLRQTIDKMHKAYRAMSAADREKLVGRELAHVTGDTPLSRELLEPVISIHFKKNQAVRAQQAPRKVNPSEMTAVRPDADEEAEGKKLIQDKPMKFRERMTGIQHKEGSSTTYNVDYTGTYCRQRPLDWFIHCEPAVIFTMHQGDSSWTRSFGPYEGVDAGEARRERRWLRGGTPFNRDLTVVGTLIEHDVGSLDEIQDAVQAAVDVVGEVIGIWWDVPDSICDAIADALSWVADVLGLTHDRIGESQMLVFDRDYAERHTGHEVSHGIEYDTYMRFRGNMRGSRNQRGDFYVFLDVRRLP